MALKPEYYRSRKDGVVYQRKVIVDSGISPRLIEQEYEPVEIKALPPPVSASAYVALYDNGGVNIFLKPPSGTLLSSLKARPNVVAIKEIFIVEGEGKE